MHLKLSVNSVRKVKWFSKLGFLKPQKPICSIFSSIKPSSTIGAISCFIERIYPIAYVEKFADGSKVCRNQRQEEQAIEKYQSDKYKSIMNRRNFKSEEGDDFLKRNVSESLKIRVTDATPGATSKYNCLLTIWQNAVGLNDELTEGQKLVVLNLAPTSQSYQDSTTIYLSTSRQTSYIFDKKNKYYDHKASSPYLPRYVRGLIELCSFLTKLWLIKFFREYRTVSLRVYTNKKFWLPTMRLILVGSWFCIRRTITRISSI